MSSNCVLRDYTEEARGSQVKFNLNVTCLFREGSLPKRKGAGAPVVTYVPRGGGPAPGLRAWLLPCVQKPRPGRIRRTLYVGRTIRLLPPLDGATVGLGPIRGVVGEKRVPITTQGVRRGQTACI